MREASGFAFRTSNFTLLLRSLTNTSPISNPMARATKIWNFSSYFIIVIDSSSRPSAEAIRSS